MEAGWANPLPRPTAYDTPAGAEFISGLLVCHSAEDSRASAAAAASSASSRPSAQSDAETGRETQQAHHAERQQQRRPAEE